VPSQYQETRNQKRKLGIITIAEQKNNQTIKESNQNKGQRIEAVTPLPTPEKILKRVTNAHPH